MTTRQFKIHPDCRRKFPELPATIPWEFIEPARGKAHANHDQSLEVLDRLGGMAPGEILCALDGKKLFPYPDERESVAELLRRLAAWSSNRPAPRTRPKEVLAKFNQWLVTRSDRYYQPQDLMGEALRTALRQRDDLRACLEHAVELGYLGEGSTAGWAKDLLESIP